LVEDQRDFALETTLSGRWLAKQILDWKCVGYEVELYYLRLSTVEVSLERIEQRVKNGGHNIPEEVARRRFDRSLGLLEELYKNLVDVWSIWNNEGDIPILLEASTWLA
jgi:predicted ABC-type ATPase